MVPVLVLVTVAVELGCSIKLCVVPYALSLSILLLLLQPFPAKYGIKEADLRETVDSDVQIMLAGWGALLVTVVVANQHASLDARCHWSRFAVHLERHSSLKGRLQGCTALAGHAAFGLLHSLQGAYSLVVTGA